MTVIADREDTRIIADLLSEAGDDQVTIRLNDRDAAVVLSPARYRELQRNETEELLELMDKIGKEAEANGLTPEILEEILADAKAERTR